MTSGDVEFLEPEPPAEPHPQQSPPARQHAGTAAWAAVVGWTAAAVLAAVAPFQRLYGSGSSLPRRYADYLPGGPASVDGWGRPVGGIRFGFALVACAAIFALLALAASERALRPAAARRLGRLSDGAAIGAPCMLAGVIVMLGIYLASSPDATTVYSRQGPGLQFESSQAYSSHLSIAFASTSGDRIAWCLWLAVAAFVCAALAAVGQSTANRGRADLAG